MAREKVQRHRIFLKYLEPESQSETIMSDENMSDENLFLLQAKQAIKEGETKAAISILLKAMNDDQNKAAAAYSLGIIYDMNSDIKNKDLATKYYSIAENMGADIATYRIAGLQQRSGKVFDALERFKKISDRNPSAAYWCYRLTKDQNPSDPQVKLYRDKAASLGHILAKRDALVDRLRGKEGLVPMLTAPVEIIKLFREAKIAAGQEKKPLYE